MKTVLLKREGDVLKPEGDLYFETVVGLWQQGVSQIQNMEHIQVDLSALHHCDSSVLALCSAWTREAYTKKKSIVFLNFPAFIKNLIRVHGLDNLLPMGEVGAASAN